MVKKAIFTLAAAAVLLTACQAEKASVKSSAQEIKIQMTAITEDDSKTSIDENNAVTWGKGEYVKMYYNDGTHKFATSDATSADAYSGSLTAKFDFTISPSAAASYKLGGMYPASAAIATEGSPVVKAVIPSVQNATATSYDPAAYIMVIRPEEVAAIPSQWQAWFRKAAALNKVTLKGVKDDIVAVEFTSTGKNFSGAASIDMTSGEITGYSDNASTVKVQYASALPAGDMDIWFTTWESTIASGGTLKITAYTASGYYTRTITAGPDGISFAEGCLNLLTVNFSSVEHHPYTLKDFARAFVTCLDVWENTVGKVDADATHNGATAWANVHLLPIVNTSSGRYKNAGNQYDGMYAPFWQADLGGKSYTSNQCWEIAIRGLMNLCTAEGDGFLPGMTNRNKAYTLANNGTLSDPIPSFSSNNQWGDYPWYEYDKTVQDNGSDITEVDVNFLIKCGSWHIVRGLITNGGNTALGKIGNYQEFGTTSGTLNLGGYVGYICPMRELLIAARIYKYLLDNNIENNVYSAIRNVSFDFGLYSANAPVPVPSSCKVGLWVNYTSMKSVDMQSLASRGVSDLFLHEYAFSKIGKSDVDNFISDAHSCNMKVHIWMQCFWWNDDVKWRVPVIDRSGDTPARYNQPLFNEIIGRAEDYLESAIDGIHLDYVRFGGTGEQHNFPQDGITAIGAITEFCRQMNAAATGIKPDIILSAALMGETGAQSAYGQDPSQMGQYMDILLPMAYISSYGYSDTQNVNVANWFKARSGGAQVWHGIATYDSDDKGLDQSRIHHDCANIISNSDADGIALFRYGIGTIPDLRDIFN